MKKNVHLKQNIKSIVGKFISVFRLKPSDSLTQDRTICCFCVDLFQRIDFFFSLHIPNDHNECEQQNLNNVHYWNAT